ncbi:hypothetical protein MASR1M12_10590 [Erysipelotrichia bacterium]
MPEYQPGTMVMVCGPAPMMLIRRDLMATGYPQRAILGEDSLLAGYENFALRWPRKFFSTGGMSGLVRPALPARL